MFYILTHILCKIFVHFLLSLQNSESLFIPSTLDELENEYEVKYTKDLLFKNPKVTRDVQCIDDAKEVVVWELLEVNVLALYIMFKV